MSWLLVLNRFEIIFCVAHPDDPARKVAQELISKYPAVRARLLIGDGEEQVGVNPKINNLMEAYRTAEADLLWILDSDNSSPGSFSAMCAKWTDTKPWSDADRPGTSCASCNPPQARRETEGSKRSGMSTRGLLLEWEPCPTVPQLERPWRCILSDGQIQPLLLLRLGTSHTAVSSPQPGRQLA
ncbi:hypothetical protein PGTUg99_027953 [Puccinia graminis f. sp. tritici]|uniref:Ceramide glucosyltransferase n=1 Tax=Puccinia graminis f. sp. tritici TaxID=56615 RepID=A0A5B0R697_PUCGR|nr:hypothetical protein PGTUg99_027953 [Puccinia graminis f. sp. tritici]